jgi:hypothetical protein
MDFWRMVVEHNVATMVVLSTEGKFWQYWPLDQGDKVGHVPVVNGILVVPVLSTKRKISHNSD